MSHRVHPLPRGYLPSLHHLLVPSHLCLFKPWSPANAYLRATFHTWPTPGMLPFCKVNVAFLSFLISLMLQHAGLLDSRLWVFFPCFSIPNPCHEQSKSKSPGVKGSMWQERDERWFSLVKREENLQQVGIVEKVGLEDSCSCGGLKGDCSLNEPKESYKRDDRYMDSWEAEAGGGTKESYPN